MGLAHIFIQHTSASLALNENADPTVRQDMESHFNRMIPENAPYFVQILGTVNLATGAGSESSKNRVAFCEMKRFFAFGDDGKAAQRAPGSRTPNPVRGPAGHAA